MVTNFLSSVTLSAVCCFMSGHLLFSSSSVRTPLCFVCCTLFNCYSVLWNWFCIAVQHTFTGKLQKTDSNEMQQKLVKHWYYMGLRFDVMAVYEFANWNNVRHNLREIFARDLVKFLRVQSIVSCAESLCAEV